MSYALTEVEQNSFDVDDRRYSELLHPEVVRPWAQFAQGRGMVIAEWWSVSFNIIYLSAPFPTTTTRTVFVIQSWVRCTITIRIGLALPIWRPSQLHISSGFCRAFPIPFAVNLNMAVTDLGRAIKDLYSIAINPTHVYHSNSQKALFLRSSLTDLIQSLEGLELSKKRAYIISISYILFDSAVETGCCTTFLL